MESTRQKKVSRLIQKELADIFLKKGNEFAHGKLVSITRVRVSPDLSFAKVYISIFPATNQDNILHSIHELSSMIRFELGQKVRKLINYLITLCSLILKILLLLFQLNDNTTVFFGADDKHGILTFDWNDQAGSLLMKKFLKVAVGLLSGL